MAFTTPRTWSTGEIVTAFQLNTHLRDNLNAIRDEDVVFASTVPSFFGAGKTIAQVMAEPPEIGATTPAAGNFTSVDIGTDLAVGNDAFITGDANVVGTTTLTGYATLHSGGSVNSILNLNAGMAMLGIATPATPPPQSIKIFPATGEHLYVLRSDGLIYPLGPNQFWICKVQKSATQSINNASATIITFDQEVYDSFTMHDNVTNNTRITVPRSGYYEVYAEISFAANATGQRAYVVLLNGTEVGRQIVGAGGAGVPATVAGSHIFSASSGQYFEVQGYQNSGGALNVVNSPPSYFSVRWIGA